MNLVKEIKLDGNYSFFAQPMCYYAIRPDGDAADIIDTLNGALSNSYGAKDFQVMKVAVKDEETEEVYDNCYVVAFSVGFMYAMELERAFTLLDLKFGRITELMNDE